MKINVLIPVHNEGATIKSIVQAIKNKGLDILVIDDGSTDDSTSPLESMGAVVLTNAVKRGKGYSLRRGFDYSVENGYKGVIMMDGDGQHDVEDIDIFIDWAQKDSKSIVTGNRMLNSQNMPWLRRMTNTFMSFIISKACQQKVPDTQCGYRYVHCDILREINLKTKDFEIETEILIQASKKGYSIYSVPIKTIYSNEKSKINPLKDTIRFFAYFFREIFSKSKAKKS